MLFRWNQTVILPGKVISSGLMAMCLMVDGKEDPSQKAFGVRRISFALWFIVAAFLLKFQASVKRYLKGQCPQGKMSCIGDYRRNVVTLKQNLNFCFLFMISKLYPDILVMN